MSKRTRYGDNSKRQQPVQQQRAQAAARQLSAANAAKTRDRGEQQTRSTPAADRTDR
ncbi:MAG: hypothetical protein ACXWC2_13635 [Ramlibacter sp.]